MEARASVAYALRDHATVVDELLQSLRRLDLILEAAVSRARAAFGPEAVADPFKGLHITPFAVRNLLARPPAAPFLWTTAAEPTPDAQSPFSWLAETFSLSAFEIDVVMLALRVFGAPGANVAGRLWMR